MALQSNLHYFKISCENPERVFDKRYASLEKEQSLKKYVEHITKIKKVLNEIKNCKQDENLDNIYDELKMLLTNKNEEFASKSEFGCFVNACDVILESLKDKSLLKEIVKLYFQNRDLKNGIPPDEWIQAIIDKGASRSKGSIGENKLMDIAKRYDFIPINDWSAFHNNEKIVAFSKGVFDIENIKNELKVDLNFGKKLDIILKNKEKIIFIEAKHLKQSGDSQNKQIKELISIISRPIGKINIFYGAFLDGIYSNKILNIPSETEKIRETNIGKQQKDILNALDKNENSFWFNTRGYEEFVKDFV